MQMRRDDETWIALDPYGFSMDEAAPFPLYTHRESHLIRWREAGHPFSRDDIDELQAAGIGML